ncbi:protein croquemort-like [Malaya genurostris]|uniref:protein croquemort-like n=1 Tax=Malaya genurostris TaxID=325434 RepID=UPI0026F3AE9A|nr:protein croquemort-like [Malaya genurostris]XP_058445851.1 protein croquemort-like [Malaya genurostris]XP_058445852.1 protein croquemort-like [Malaya genurostris]XP_058445853.1 protein croquemort-like [Malaya genurostris]
MCSSCSDFQKKMVSFGCSVLLILIAIILGTLWPTMSSQMLHEKLVLKNGSVNYQNWIKTPIPMFLEIYMFNWTNPNELHRYPEVKPHFEEMGPYVFQEVHERVGLVWNNNDTITFNQRRTWRFDRDLSKGSLNDTVTNLNVISLNVAYFERNATTLEKMVINKVLDWDGSVFWYNKTIREILFEGFDDTLLDLLKTLNNTVKVPFDKFGWFVNRNLSDTYDGTFTIQTGADSLENVGVLTQWNGANHTGMYRGKCGEVRGTTGELWPVMHSNKTNVTIFASDVCRSLTLQYIDEVTIHNVEGAKYVGDDQIFDNGVKYPETACWCNSPPAKCPDVKPGVFNASACKYGSPTFVSYPHFYLADQSYRDAIDGMTPNKTKHEFYIAIEPHTGIPLDVRAQLQINMHLQPIKGIKMYENMPDIIVPMLWFTQRATLTEDLANQAKMALVLPKLGIYISIFLGTVGILMTGIFAFLTIRKWSEQVPYEELLR